MQKIKIPYYCILLVIFFSLISNSASAVEPQNSQKKVSIGVFITSLYELNMNAGSYNADIWIWSESQIKDEFELDRIEFSLLHGKYPLDTSLKYKENLNDSISFENRKIRATFLHDYNLELFPFDKQILRFNIEGTDSTDELTFIPSSNSGISSFIQISGWRINSFKIIPTAIDHGTNFGYPQYTSKVKYPLITVEVELIRNSFYLFFKLLIGLIVSVLIASLSTTISTYNDDLYGSRISIIGGSLLAGVLNQQFADSKADTITTITLVDTIHLIGITTIGCLFVSSIIFRYISQKTDKKINLSKLDFLFGIISFVLFIAISAIIVIVKI